MAIITVRSSTGFPYAFNIAGSTPTPEEQIRIDTFLAEKNAGLAALAAEQTPAEGDKEEAGFLDTIGLGGTQIKGAFGTVLEETGKLVGSDDMRRYGRSVQGQARDDMYEKLINMPELKEYDDIKGIGDAFTFAKQQAGMQAANLGISLTGTIGGTIAGGAAGSAVPIVGNVAGAIAGGIAGGALASAPLLYASNINRQKSEYAKGNIDKIDQWGALRATVGQAAMEGLADRFLIGKFIGPSQFKNIFVRGTVGLGTGAALEGLTEAGQQLIERYQAGLDISSDEAIEEYLSSAAAGAVLGGGIGGLGGVLSKSSAKIKQEQLERDLIASENDFKARVEKANKPILQLPAPETTLSLPTPTRLALPAPSPDARYNQTEMDAVTAALEDGKKLTIPSIQKILRGLRKDKVPLQDARDILSELERRGAVEGNAKAPTTVDGKGEFVSPAGAGRPVNYYPERSIRKEIDALKTEVEKDTDSLIKLNVEQRTAEQTGFDLDGKKKNANTVLAEIAKTQEGIATKQQRIVDATEQLAKAKEIYDTPTSDYVPIEAGRKLGELADAPIEVIADRLEAQKNDLANSANTLNRAKRRSTSLKKKKKLTDVEQAELDNLSGVIGRLATKVASLAEVSTKTPEQIKQQAQFERNRQNAQADEQQTILDNKARAAQARAILEQASATQAPTFSYNQKQRDVLSKLRQRLSNLGIKDIKLQAVAGTKIDGNGNLVAESEGSFSAMNKLITLSMSMYDPNLTPQQLFNSLSEVMNHEVIHALSEAGVLTNSELKILARSVRGTKYTTMVDGKLTKRMYSYFDRAERLYPTYSTDKAKDGLPSMLEEEAIAEMFRDYLAGRLTKKEIPSSIFQKMKNFFMALMKSHAESGFDSVDKIFEGIRRGEIGARDRQISPREQITDQSEVKLSAVPVAIEDTLNEQDQQDAKTIVDGQRLSAIPVPLVPSPIKKADGSMSYIYGIMEGMDRKKKFVTFPEGNHQEFSAGNTKGEGMQHIVARGHDKELMQYSKYPSVQQAVYDMIYRFTNTQKGNGNAGINPITGKENDIISYRSHGGNLTLEWRNNRGYGAKYPLLLALHERKTNGVDHYGVHTFYPIVERARTKFSAIPVVGSQPITFDEYDRKNLDAPFSIENIDNAARQNDQSRELLVMMNIDDFLAAAAKITPSEQRNSDKKLADTRNYLKEEGFFNGVVPSLSFENNGDGTGLIVSHDGRHRAMAMQEAGYDVIPVLMTSVTGGKGRTIRWGQQDNPTSDNYIDPAMRPKILMSQDKDVYIQLPTYKDDSNARTTRRSERDRNGRGINIVRAETPLDGTPQVSGATGPDVRIVNIAEAYAAENGIDFKRQAEYVTIDPEFSASIADAYDNMEHAPKDPDVLRAYDDLIEQTTAQYKALEDAGYSFYFFDKNSDPYDSKPFNAMRDLRENKRMGVFSTAAGYGPDDDFNILDNPMLRDTGMKWPFGSPNGPKETVYANDLFRAVHDAFGHSLEGSGFRGRGEENAWQAHVRLFTGDAIKALTSETRGQNSWLNYGPFGEKNRTASVAETIFAKQKVGLMPSFTWEERRSPDMPTEGSRELFSAIPQFLPKIPLAPQGVKAHKLPNILLGKGNGEKALYPITQAFTLGNARENGENTQAAKDANPNPLASVDAWRDAMQEAFGGDYLPVPPLNAMKYANNVNEIVNKVLKLTPELKAGVDRGFAYVKKLQSMYASGTATPQMTMQLFIWGILSRGAGPVQQESAYIDIINDAMPFVEKAIREPLTLGDVNQWESDVSANIPEGSPAKQVTMNVNAAARLIYAMSQFAENSNRTIIDIIHEDMMDQNVSASDIRRTFLSNTKGAGIDNKVLSFILLVSGRDDVLVMDRIQGRHMWDDGRYGGENIYDGIGKQKEGLNGIFRGPRGLFVTEIMEEAIRPNVREAYRQLGRPQDGTLGRFHWETWVIDGEQVVDHSTLGAIIANSPTGFSVTEGKTDTFSSQSKYIRGTEGPVIEYPTQTGLVYMKPVRFKEFLSYIKDTKNGIIPKGFLVTKRADIPWFMRPEVDRLKLDIAAKEFEDANSDGRVFASNEGLGANEKSVPTRLPRGRAEQNAEQRAAVSGREGSKYGTVIPQRGEGANEAAMAAFDEQLSAIYVSSNSGAQTPNVGPRDLMRHFEDLRYTGVTDFISSTLKNVGVKVFRVNPETEKKIESNTIGFISKLQDDMLPVGIMYDKLRKAYGSIPQAYDAYFKEQLYHGIIEPLVMKFRNDVSTPLIKRIATLKLTPAQTQALANISPYYRKVMGENRYNSYAAANAFLYASHAKERNRRIKQLSRSKDVKGSGMPDTEADAILAWVRGLSPQQRADFDFIKLSARNIVKQTNDVYIKGDLIPDYLSQDVTLPDGTVEAFTEYSDYVPLTGFADADQEAVDTRGGGGGKAAFGALSKPNRSAVGRESYAGDILANLFHQYEAAIPKAERNKVGLAFLKLLESDIPTDGYAQVLQTRPMKKAISNGRIRYVPDRDFDKKYDPDDANSPIMAVRRGGKEVLIGIHDRRIASAMKGSTAAPVAAHPIVNGLHAFTRTYANLLTTWNPEFMLGNLPRDIETAIVNSQQFDMQGTGKHILKKVGPAIKQIYLYNTNRKDPNNYWQKRYEQFYNGGGQNVLNQMSSSIKKTQDVRKIIDEIVIADKGGNRARVKQLFTGETNSLYASFNALIEANGAVENGTRLAFFDAMMTNLEAQGVPTDLAVERAAFHARNLTTNFAKGGEYKNGFNTAYLFFNASLQGAMALLNAMYNSKKVRKAIAGIVVLGFASDMINAILSSDDDDDGIKDYDTINEYTLSHNFLFPDVFGTGENFKIPLGYGLNTFFNSGRVLSNLLRGTIGDKGTYDASQAAASVVGTIGDLINPFGGSNKWNWIVPTQLDLPFELITNKNFMNQSIYKELSPYEQYSSASNLYWSTTSPSAIWISKFINSLGGGGEKIPGTILGQRVDIQPDVIEHIVEFLSGGVGRFAMRSLDTATNTLPSALMGQWEDDMINKTPFLSKYLQTVTDKDKAGKYYENRDEILSVRAEIKNAQQSGDIESVRDVIKRYPEEVRLIGFVNAIENSLRKLRTVKKKIGLSTKISEEDKKTRIKAIDDRISALISRANMRMEE
jgi:hypothetical protein